MKTTLLAALFALGGFLVADQATLIHSSGTLPTTCSVGNIYIKTGASAGLYACLVTDTWTGPYATSAALLTTPGTTTDNAVVRWNGTGGTAIQNSGITIDDADVIGFPDGVKQTFNPDGTNAGVNIGAQSGDPSSLANGDIWYNSSTDKFRCRQNGATSDCFGPGSGGGDVVKIEEQTPSGTGAVTFSSLGSYTHLRIVYSARGTESATATTMELTFNGDTGSNYDSERVSFTSTIGFATQVAQTNAIIGFISAATATSNYASGSEIYIPDYRGTTFYKTAFATQSLLQAQSSGNIGTRLNAAFWRSTSAITSVTLTLTSGNYVSGSKFTLYGMN